MTELSYDERKRIRNFISENINILDAEDQEIAVLLCQDTEVANNDSCCE